MTYENNVANYTMKETNELSDAVYTCRAVNEAGSVETKCKVTVQGELLSNLYRLVFLPRRLLRERFYNVPMVTLQTFLRSMLTRTRPSKSARSRVSGR